MLRKILQTPAGVAVASALIGFYIRLVIGTMRWRYEGEAHLADVEAEPRGYIVAFWHHQLMLFPAVRDRTTRAAYMLSSRSRDGEIIVRAGRGFGVTFIRGSAANPRKPGRDKSGASAILQMTAALREGGVVGMTPDGPRGPARRVQPGVLRLAMQSDAPVLPVAAAAARVIRLKTWDRFALALPFARGAFVAGPPIRVTAGDDLDAARQQLETAIDAAAARAEALARGSPLAAKVE